jgi:hypothetical protein
MMVAGLGLVGGTLRRRVTAVGSRRAIFTFANR